MNIWGCMSRNGVGMLIEVEGRMDAKQYVEILDQHLPKLGKLWDFLWRKPFFSKTMIPNTPPYWPKLGSRMIESIHFQFLVYSSHIDFLRPVIDSTSLMEWSDKRREITFALSAEEIALMVKKADKCGMWLLKPFVTSGDRRHDFSQNFLPSLLYVIKQRKLGNSGSKSCPNEWPF